MRRFEDAIEVRPAEGPDARPEAFIWRGRLYVVRQILMQWRERRAWWRDALEPTESPGSSGAPETAGSPAAPGSPGSPARTALAAAAAEREVWRVEAAPGWSFTPGVYDLVHEPPLPGERANGTAHPASTASGLGDRWTLVRVAD